VEIPPKYAMRKTPEKGKKGGAKPTTSVRQGEGPKKKNSLPELGQPGGLHDPLSRGEEIPLLSSSGHDT